MSAQRVARPQPWVGCVVAGETGVVVVLTDAGEVRASYGGCLLGRIARDRRCIPGPGDWVVLRRWSDDRITVEDVWSRTAPDAEVIPLHPR